MRLLTEQEPISMNDGSIKPLNEVASGETYTLPTATATRLGGVKVGDGLSVTSAGVLSAESYTLPAATAETLGGVKVGDGLSVTEDGTLSTSGGGGSTKYIHNIIVRYSVWGGFAFTIILATNESLESFTDLRSVMVEKMGANGVLNAYGVYSGNTVIGVSFSSLSDDTMNIHYIDASNKSYTYAEQPQSAMHIYDTIMEV